MWADLYDAHQHSREVPSGTDVATRLRERLKFLVGRGHCDQRFQGKLDYKKNPTRGKAEIWVKAAADHPLGEPIPIRNLPALEEGRLWIGVMLDQRRSRVEKFTVRLDGRARTSGLAWLVSVELDERRMGAGACSHAPIHCHVGPDHTAEPQVRVPCPPMRPWDALDWVLTVVLPDWEPLPWVASTAHAQRELAMLSETAAHEVPEDLLLARRTWFQRWGVGDPAAGR